MKKGNVLLKAIAILAIVLISLISFLGIHKRNLNKWENVIPKFKFSKELSQARIYGFVVDDSTEEVENSDSDDQSTENSNTTTSATNSTEEDTKSTTEVPVNDPNVLTKENYKKSKRIIEERLKVYGITDTTVSVNQNNGEITVSAPFDDSSNYSIDLITRKGDVEVVDTETKEVLISKDKVTKATAFYQPTSNENADSDKNYYDFGVRLTFNQEGQKKLREISRSYIASLDSEGKETQKTITVKIDGEDKFTTWFPNDTEFTELPIKLYQYVSADDAEVWNNTYNRCKVDETVINTETLPIAYEIATGTFIESEMNDTFIKTITIIGLVVLAIVILITIMKFKKEGILVSLIEIAYIAIHLLLIRVAGVSLAISGILTIGFMALVNYILLMSLMNSEKVMDKIEAFGRFVIILIPFIITAVTFTLGKEINIQSIGMVAIWGILTFACTLVTAIILLNTPKDEKNGVEKDEE